MSVITTAAYAAASDADDLASAVQAFLDTAVAKASDGITWAEFGELLIALLRLAVTSLDVVSGMDGAEKKALVMVAVGTLLDRLADRAVPPIALPMWWLVRPAVRSLLMSLASGAVEALLPLVRA